MYTLPYRHKTYAGTFWIRLQKGQATMEDLDKLEELCYHLKDNSLCALGQTAPTGTSTLRYFRRNILHIS